MITDYEAKQIVNSCNAACAECEEENCWECVCRDWRGIDVEDKTIAYYQYDTKKKVWRCSNCGASLPDGVDEDNMPFTIEDVNYCYHCGSPMSNEEKIPYHFMVNWMDEDFRALNYGVVGLQDTFKEVIIRVINDMMADYRKVCPKKVYNEQEGVI